MAAKAPEYPEPRFYSREFKLEAVRLSESSEKVSPRLLGNSVSLKGCSTGGGSNCGRSQSRLFRARDIKASWKRRTAACAANWSGCNRSVTSSKKREPSSRTASHEIRLRRQPGWRVSRQCAVPDLAGLSEWLLCLAQACSQCPSAGRRAVERPDSPRLRCWPWRLWQSPHPRLLAMPGNPLWPQTCCAAHACPEGMCGTLAPAPAPHDRQSTVDSQHTHPVAPNLLERDFTASAPNRKWVADSTAIGTRAGWLYFAGIVDGSSRRAIG